MKVITDVHEASQAQPVADVVDVIQLPAFWLVRLTGGSDGQNRCGHQREEAAVREPGQMGNIVDKFIEGGNDKVILCDRGSNFGYDNRLWTCWASP